MAGELLGDHARSWMCIHRRTNSRIGIMPAGMKARDMMAVAELQEEIQLPLHSS